MKNKKGNINSVLGVGIFIMLLLFGAMFAYYLIFKADPETQSATNQQIVQQVAQASKDGDAATLYVTVVDNAATSNINTRLAVATYCWDEKGNFVIDGTSSSTSVAITGATTVGRTISCVAYDSTHQTVTPATVVVSDESPTLIVNAFTLPVNGKISIYNDQLQQSAVPGVVNVTGVGASGTGTMAKIRVTNNNTNTILPLGGVYFATVPSSNVTEIDISGNALLSLKSSAHLPKVSAASWSKSGLKTTVTTRKDNWDYAFEVSGGEMVDNVAKALLLEANDYVESGTVRVKGNGNGCQATVSETISSYGFTKGYFKTTASGAKISYGHENDAPTASVISTDVIGSTTICLA